jgi:hypothetical protein
MQVRTHWPGLILLLLLSPLAAELLSGSAPPAEFFTGWAILLVTWYGLGAILCRELSIRWRSGLAGLFLLGAAFGILEEGILIKTFFDPNAIDLGSLQSFGWWVGANWPWMVQLTLYHALVSITLPVLVVTSLWPEQRDRPWLSRRAILAVAGLLAVLAVLGWFILSPAGEWPPYWPGAGQFLGALAAIGLLVAAARRIHRQPAASALTRRWPLFLAGLGWGVWQFGAWIVADATRSTWLTIAWAAGVGLLLLAFAYRRLWPLDRPALIGAGTLAAGTWLFWSLLAFIQEADNANRPDDTSGMALVGLVALLLLAAYLVYLACRWKQLRQP